MTHDLVRLIVRFSFLSAFIDDLAMRGGDREMRMVRGVAGCRVIGGGSTRDPHAVNVLPGDPFVRAFTFRFTAYRGNVMAKLSELQLR